MQAPPACADDPTQGANGAETPSPARREKITRATAADLEDMLAADPGLNGAVRFDMLRRCVAIAGALPWDCGSPLWSNADLAELQLYAETRHGLLATLEALSVAVHRHAHRNRFHPLRDYLASLVWDRRKRIDRWLCKYCGAEDTPFTRAISRRFLLAAVARAAYPGAKVDAMAVLEGGQGIGKSRTLRTLAGDEFFNDAPLNFTDVRQGAEAMTGVWIWEVSELAGMGRAEVAAIKRFLSATEDRYRPAYGREVETVPRSCVFVGTTNPDASGEYLRDRSGNRRFWPVRVQQCKVDAIARDRDQLWAEAVVAYGRGEHWWLEKRAHLVAAEHEVGTRLEENPWLDRTRRYVDANPVINIRVAHVFEIAMNRALTSRDMGEQKLIADALAGLGYTKQHARHGNVWIRPAGGEPCEPSGEP
ncbi:VapE domain-containing protein [Paraburkholderia youngii]|uniref:VapE domain-containing protein n=1 Tax=Paraburkholderia youngii TaxID=2782701 RepID=UPI003D25EB3F